ncbi:MAG: Hsp70 family protein, partial [Lachnospiraceae bacterium]|nr:Hsp70 family protein [Lachnospiraceae bacterium]
LGTGKEQHITITAGSNMSDADIEKAGKEAAEFEAQDKKRKEAIETRNDADAFVFQTEKALEEVGDKIDAADKANVEADLQALKTLVENTNAEEMSESQVEEMKAAKEKLMNSAQQLFTKVYEQAQAGATGAGPAPDMGGAQAGPAPDMGSSSSSADDDVVDADYKEV